MKHLLLALLAMLISNQSGYACTTAVISGKYTANGRPIIWKLRDTETFENKMRYFSDGKYDYIGMINSNDAQGEQVWGGSNAAGFAIMNSASFNVNMDDTTSFKDQEGYFMKEVLMTCATLADFEKLIEERPVPKGLAAHFGVLDAQGGVAFYEVNNRTFTKFDANDPAQAPNGYIIRTNYSFTGKKDVGYGFIRYQIAQDIFYQADAMGQLNSRTIIQDFSRCLKHSVLDKDFREEYSTVPKGPHFINSGDMITRHGSSSTLLIEGVAKGESPELSTIWTMIGFPNTCIALPVWMKGGNKLPAVLVADDDNNCPLNTMALTLKDRCYPIKRSAGYKYLNVSELINSEGTGIIQELEKVEEDIFLKTKELLESSPNEKQIADFYNYLDSITLLTYNKL
ncbi:hypothetical protein J1N10_19430 [Carboxylicivirga sp. A043]|uniref:hypothetical protein n=1 Tax=Carboxylicivirga litoralis TaxID=2816963 RepID=UPI0021CB4E83|nr:hypothetical protein [Carboxylicivirga sp. A043]MCU4158155.1 hypothetical protein [Carboxylicivirga sp. A043]